MVDHQDRPGNSGTPRTSESSGEGRSTRSIVDLPVGTGETRPPGAAPSVVPGGLDFAFLRAPAKPSRSWRRVTRSGIYFVLKSEFRRHDRVRALRSYAAFNTSSSTAFSVDPAP